MDVWNPTLLVVCLCIAIGVIFYFFYLNRLMAFLAGLLIRLIYWDEDATSIWVDIGSIHLSIIAGRLLLRDVRYHSSNQTIKIVKAQISWRYWIRRPATEQDTVNARVRGELDKSRAASCRVHVSFQGFEWFLYNRTAAYDNIVAQMESTEKTPRPSFQKPSSIGPSRVYPPSLPPRSSATPTIVRRAIAWVKRQLPNLDIKDVLPLGIQITKGAIICGNASTPNLLVAEFQHVDGTFGIVQSRSKHDLYKQNLNLRFQLALIRYVQNDSDKSSMIDYGARIREEINKSAKYSRTTPVSYIPFSKLWRRLALYTIANLDDKAKHTPKHTRKSLDDAAVNVPEYAIERQILEAPILELAYYVDVAGIVPYPEPDNAEISADTPPEWGVDLIVRNGVLSYGPWADRQRAELQKAFFPPTYHDFEVPPPLQPGDGRAWVSLQVFVELRDETKFHIPFRESSKDWQWDGVNEYPRSRKRQPGSLYLTAGDRSSISYCMPMIATPAGFEPQLEVHLDSIALTTKLNDMKLLNAESCRVRCELPSPLKWNAERKWTIGISLRQPILHLLRDHVNMFTDLGKDWSSGPPSDYQRFIPMTYAIEVEMHHYEINTYANDHNIIDKPLLDDENVLMTIRGSRFKTESEIPLNKFRPESTNVQFVVNLPNMALNISLPRWNTHALCAPKNGYNIGTAETFLINGSYRYYAEVHDDNVEQLKLNFITRRVAYKAFGWSIRYFMVMRENYFGSFTHSCTLAEYMLAREMSATTGDPVIKKYRPGLANMLQVELGLSLIGAIMIMPASLSGYEASDPSGPRIGSCVVMHLPELQVQLRLHDFYMEMALNIETISGRVADNCPEQVMCSDTELSRKEHTFLIDGIDITANRLFGPLPKTSTYVCIWDIQVGNLKAIVSPMEGRIIMAAGEAFGTNFVDAVNAPADTYATPLDPDVSFVKVVLQGLDVTWRGGNTAIAVSLPLGLKIDNNDLGGQLHRKMTSVRVPHASLKILLRPHPNSATWTEAFEFATDAYLDIYSSPPGWLDTSLDQSIFVHEQDLPTGRAKRMLHSLHKTIPDTSGKILHVNGVYIPQPTLSGMSNIRSLGERSSSKETIQEVHTPKESSSEEEEYLPAADRDALVAQTRAITPLPFRASTQDDENLTSGEESDNEDLTSHDSSDSEWDDSSARPEGSHFSRLAHVARRYQAKSLQKPHLWEGSPFRLVKDPRPNRRAAHADETDPKELHLNGAPVPENDADTAVFRLQCRSPVKIDITPLMLPALSNIAAEMQYHVLGPELSLDALSSSYSSSSVESLYPKNSIFDIRIASVEVHLLQTISLQTEDRQGLFVENDAVASIFLSLDACRVMFFQTTRPESSPNFGIASHVNSAFLSLGKFSENLRQPNRVSRPTDALTISLSDFGVSTDVDRLQMEFEVMSANVNQLGPEYLAAISTTLLDNVNAAQEIMGRWTAHTSSRLQNIFYDALQRSIDKPMVDPFSTIQPSILVQIDRPGELRDDSALKLLFHLRNAFWKLDATEREKLRSTSRQHYPETDVLPLLDSIIEQLSLETDISDSALKRILKDIFIQNDPKKSTAPIPFTSISFRIGHLSVVIRNSARKISVKGDLSSFVVDARLRTLDVIQPSAQSVTLSRTSLVERPLAIRSWMASTYLGNLDVSLLPGVIHFAQQVLRVRRHYAAKHSSKSSRPRDVVSNPMSDLVEMTMVFHRIRLSAAAEKLVFELGISNARIIATLLRTANNKLDMALNYSMIFQEIFLRALSTDDISRRKENDLLASLAFTGGKLSSVMRNDNASMPAFRVAVRLDKMQFSVPRSALRLYRFVEEWRADFFPGIEATLQDLLAEIDQVPMSPISKTRSTATNKYSPFQVHIHILSLGVSLQVMHGTWLSWEVSDIVAYLKSTGVTSTALTFGLQTTSQVFRVATRAMKQPTAENTQVKLRLPKVSMTGDYDGLAVNALALVEEFKLRVRPSDWDTLLAVQQKFGHDFNDLVALFEENRAKRNLSKRKARMVTSQPMKYNLFFKMKGFRIGFEGVTSTVYLQCKDIGGGVTNNGQLSWHVELSSLDLSLVPRVLLDHDNGAFDKTRRSAFVTIDFRVQAGSQTFSSEKTLSFSVTKFHAVMQPSSIGQLGDFADEMRAEMLERKEQRASELAAFRDKTKSVLKTFEGRIQEYPQDAESWLGKYIISLSIQNIGVAFPLIMDQSLELPPTGSLDSASVRAFLFSIQSLAFSTQHGETGQAIMKGFSFQFVSRFRPLVSQDFSGDAHVTRNRLVYPEMQAQIQSETIGTSRQVRIGANVTGFILDIDPSISDWVFSLIDVARQGKERVERLTANLPPAATSPIETQSPASVKSSPAPSNISGSLTFLSGKVRIHSGSSRFSKSTAPYGAYDEQRLEAAEDVLDLPVLTVWSEYRAAPTIHDSSNVSAEPSLLIFKSTIHSSQNILRPTLLPFITELVDRIEARMRKATSPTMHVSLPPALHNEPTPETPEFRPASSMNISLALRIDQSKLELTCQPDVNVIAGLHWDSGGFMVNITPKQLVFSGSVAGLTMGLKHGFLSDQDCVRLDARNLNFNLTFSKKALEKGSSVNTVSLVLDTEFSGVVRFSRLQDMLCFKAVWLDRIPLFTEPDSGPDVPAPSPSASHISPPKNELNRPEFTTTILVRIRQIHLDVDLGQSISSMTLDLNSSILRTKITESFHEVYVLVSDLGVVAKGNLSGELNVPDCVFQTIRRRDFGESKMLELGLTSGALTVSLESDNQPLLHYRAEPLDIQIGDDWSTVSSNSTSADNPLRLSFTVIGTEIVAVATVGTIPKIMSYINKFKVNLAIQREGASRESSAFRVTRSPKPENPLSAVANAMLLSAQDRFKETEGLAHTIRQHMSLRLETLRLVVFPRSMRDSELAEFIGRKVHARLDRIVYSENLPAKRDLHLSFAGMTISKLSQLSHMAANANPVSRHVWLDLLLKNPAVATIVGLPSMNMRMESEEITENSQQVLVYDFKSEFVRPEEGDFDEDIFITLNVSLYSWLTVLRKNLAREMVQVRGTTDWRPLSTAVSPTGTMRRKVPDPINIDGVMRSPGGGQRSAMSPTSPFHSPRSATIDQTRSATSSVYPTFMFRENNYLSPVQTPLSAATPVPSSPVGSASASPPMTEKSMALIYKPRARHIQRLTMRQLGEATPDLMHPFFMKKAGFNLEDALPQYVNEYATTPLEEIMAILLKVYSKQLLRNLSEGSDDNL